MSQSAIKPDPKTQGYGAIRLFQPVKFGDLSLRNRVVMAPMTRRMAKEDGIATPEIVEYYRRRAKHEVGLIISEGTGIDGKHAYDTLTVPRFETDEQLAAWKKVVDAVHEEGGAFAPQLWHTGMRAVNPIGPCDDQLPDRPDGTKRPPVRAMVDEDFEQVLSAFAHSAESAKEIGCDALEIHGAHGYLLDSFLSASTNWRTDEYGGSVENRMRFPLQVVKVVRQALGPNFPIIYRFSQWKMDNYEEMKFRNPEELSVWVNALKKAGVDILHVSTRRAIDPAFSDVEGDMSLAGWSQKLSGLPTIAVGSVSVTLSMDQSYGKDISATDDPSPAINLVENEEVEMLAVGRALISNPDWVQITRDKGWQHLKPYDKSLLEKLY